MKQQFNDRGGSAVAITSPPASPATKALRAFGLGGILVINVRAFAERRTHILKQLAAHGLECEFVHAFDVDEIDPETDRWYFDGQGLTPDVKSCSLKHIEALNRAVSRGWGHVLVLEDDALLSDDFVNGLEHALKESRARASPHVVYLGSGGNQYTPRSLRVPGKHLYTNKRGRLTDSYLIGIEAAKARLTWIAENKMNVPIDHAFDRMDSELGIEILWFEDPIVEQGSKNGRFPTTLEGSRPPWKQGAHFLWKKVWQKHVRQLWR